MKFTIKGGYLVDPLAGKEGFYDLLIEDGFVKGLAPCLPAGEGPVLDLKGKAILPGLVDMHCHLREPGFTYKEDIASGSAAAVAGGFTAVACMPNTEPVLDNEETIAFVLEKARKVNLARVIPFGALTEKQQGKKLAPLEKLAEAGCRGFSDDGRPVANASLVYQALQKLHELALPVISHCEDPDLAAGGVAHLSSQMQKKGLPGIPVAAESIMVARDIQLARETGGWVHIAHVSAASSVSLIAAARANGIRVTAEVTPHHLLLSQEDVFPEQPNTKVNPPLRDLSDRQALQQALQERIIDIIATDHAPHAPFEKEKDFLTAPFGMIGLETALPLLLTMSSRQGWPSLRELVLYLSARPAQLLKLKAGTLQPGYPADLTVVDLKRRGIIKADCFHSKSMNSPFLGWEYEGKPCLTMVQGQIKMLEGKVGENIPLP
ncbi:MAG: dihydroorotase [Firmicutes bacterium]|nr:dihydroorotase [Bacillota bacterium]